MGFPLCTGALGQNFRRFHFSVTLVSAGTNGSTLSMFGSNIEWFCATHQQKELQCVNSSFVLLLFIQESSWTAMDFKGQKTDDLEKLCGEMESLGIEEFPNLIVGKRLL